MKKNMKILIAYDGSDCAEAALDDLAQAGLPKEPAWELVFTADKWKPDLIIVGSHGRSVLGRFVLGSVSQRVLTEARSSVRVARGRVEEPDTPVRIIVGIDGSPASHAAVRAVAERCWPAQSQVRVVVVDDPLEATLIGELLPPIVESVAFSNRLDRAKVEKLAEDAAKLIRSKGLHVSVAIEEGDPRHVLPKVAEKWGANCIFVGATGFSNRFERFLLGSVSASVAARAHCSVEVVRSRAKRKRKTNGN